MHIGEDLLDYLNICTEHTQCVECGKLTVSIWNALDAPGYLLKLILSALVTQGLNVLSRCWRRRLANFRAQGSRSARIMSKRDGCMFQVNASALVHF